MNERLFTRLEVLVEQLSSIFEDDGLPFKARLKAGRVGMDLMEDIDYMHRHEFSNNSGHAVIREYDKQLMEIYAMY